MTIGSFVVRPSRLVTGVATAILVLGLSAQTRADMSVGRNTAAAWGDGSIDAVNVNPLSSLTITKTRRHTVILVDASVTGIEPGATAEVHLSINGVLSGPVTYCPTTSETCSLHFHRPIDVDDTNLFTVGEPVTFQLLAFSFSGSIPGVQYGFSAHVVKK